MTEHPTAGGSYIRDAKTGALSQAAAAETPPAADAVVAPAQSDEPAPRRATSKEVR